MGTVDPDDDTIRRWVLYHYRFDPSRHERRNVPVAAYDNEVEFRAEFDRLVEVIRSDIGAGSRSDSEHVSGLMMEPGHLAAASRNHEIRRAIEHGVSPRMLLPDGPLPSNMTTLSSTEDQFAGTGQDESAPS